MALGLPYDSEAGRALAAAVTSLMTGHAYATSARTASRMGPFAGFADNERYMLDVLRMHRDAVGDDPDHRWCRPTCSCRVSQSWDEAVAGRRGVGCPQQPSVGACSDRHHRLMMDCDTTGIEPDLGLVKFKKLVGGGSMSIVNQTVPRALRRLGYAPQQIDAIIAYIDAHKSIVGCATSACRSPCRCSPVRWVTTRSTTRVTSA